MKITKINNKFIVSGFKDKSQQNNIILSGFENKIFKVFDTEKEALQYKEGDIKW